MVALWLSAVTAPRPIVPDYRGANLVNVVPGLLRAPGERPSWFPAPLAHARQVLLLVADGLGWLQLHERAHLAPVLSGMPGGPITTVAPSTTATALTSITVGAAPAVHGVVGFRVVVEGPAGPEVLNVLRWRTPSGDARPFVDPLEFQPLEAFGGRPVPVVSKAEFAGTGFSDAHQRGALLASWVVTSSLPVEARRLLAGGEPLVYAYYEGIDKVAHVHGFGAHYDAELAALDRLVGDLLDVLPPGAALAVTADHGQVEVGPRARTLDERVAALTAMTSGEARFRWLHADGGGPAAVERLAAAAEEVYGQEAWVATVGAVEEQGWFGGRLDDRVRGRLGDVALVPHEPVGYLDARDPSERILACRHGSLTPEEMLVPFVARSLVL